MLFLSITLIVLGLILKIYSNAMHLRRHQGNQGNNQNQRRAPHVHHWLIALHNQYPVTLYVLIGMAIGLVAISGLANEVFLSGLAIGGLSFLIGWLIPSIGSSTREKLMKIPWKLIAVMIAIVWFLIDPLSFKQVLGPALLLLAFYLVGRYVWKKIKFF